MQRREFLLTSAALAAGAIWPASRSMAAFNPSPESGWRTFEVTLRVEVLKPEGATRVWLPLLSMQEKDWIRPMGNLWQGSAASARLLRNPDYGAEMLYAEWEADEKPVLEVTSRIAARDRAIDLDRPGQTAPLSRADRRLYTRATKLLPTDGIVKKTALDITRGAQSDQAKARALYEWVVDNTFRNPKTRGCGLGDIRTMLITGDLSDKCADLNALYVGLARAAGLRHAMSTASAWRTHASATRAWARAATSARPSIAAPRYGCRGMAGCRSTPPTCARWCWKNHPAASVSPMTRWSRCASVCSVPGK
jgi:hypothetical protein